jgi:hypothetical protein
VAEHLGAPAERAARNRIVNSTEQVHGSVHRQSDRQPDVGTNANVAHEQSSQQQFDDALIIVPVPNGTMVGSRKGQVDERLKNHCQGMIPETPVPVLTRDGSRFSEKIMLKTKIKLYSGLTPAALISAP